MTDENTTLIALTVTATAREGGQSVTVAEPVTGNGPRRYKITDADKKPEVEFLSNKLRTFIEARRGCPRPSIAPDS